MFDGIHFHNLLNRPNYNQKFGNNNFELDVIRRGFEKKFQMGN
jgi:hypothetical protein